MLYDNAQQARVYLHAWQVTGNEFLRTITAGVLDSVIREMTYVGAGANVGNTADVAFYSTQDADSEGVEGKFFVWTPDEIREVLGNQASPLAEPGGREGGADAFLATYGVTRHGNFEGNNILEFVGDMNQRAAWPLSTSICVPEATSQMHSLPSP